MIVNGKPSGQPLRAKAADRTLGPWGRHAWALVAAVAVAADQVTKAAAFDHVAKYGTIDLTPFLAIRTGMNPGIAFGLATQAQPVLLVAVAAAVSLVLLILIWRSENHLQRIALGLILGGAFGNIVDRLRFGAVRDVIDLHWAGWHSPTFNLADAFITIGVLILLFVPDPADRNRHKNSTLSLGEQGSGGSRAQ